MERLSATKKAVAEYKKLMGEFRSKKKQEKTHAKEVKTLSVSTKLLSWTGITLSFGEEILHHVWKTKPDPGLRSLAPKKELTQAEIDDLESY